MTPQEALKRYFGYPDFREGQAEIVAAVLEGRDVLAVRPTGSGKTVCFQLPAMMMKGITFVISPLISLMQDQVEEVEGTEVTATLLNSQISQDEYRQRLRDIERQKYKIVYLAPERLTQDRFLLWMKTLPLAMVVVDEAHCISQWGGDFRFAYSQIGRRVDRLASMRKGKIQRMALSASVTDDVQADIRTKLNMAHPLVFMGGFNRPNLRYRSIFCASNDGRTYHLNRLLARVKEGSAIVYGISVKDVERRHALLEDMGYSVTYYHGRMTPKEREANQQAWIDGDKRIIVATNAFGMGINKPDVRMVVHAGYPPSPEDYVQEAGRAGRDGEPSDCIILWTKQDSKVQDILVGSTFPSEEMLKWVYSRLHGRPEEGRAAPIVLADWAKNAPFETRSGLIEQSLRFLEQQDIIHLTRGPSPGLLGVESFNPEAQFDYRQVAARESKARHRLKQVVRYLEATGCRAVALVKHFAPDASMEACGVCDNCISADEPDDGLSELEIAALHLVKSTKQRLGRAKIRLVLDGVFDPKVLASKLQLYPEFGVCQGADTTGGSLIEQLLAKKLMRLTVEPKYKALALTDKGYRLLRKHYGDSRQNSDEVVASVGPAATVEALLNLRADLAEGYDIPAERIWSREEAETIAKSYDPASPDWIISEVLGDDRSVLFGFRIISHLAQALPQ